MNAKNCLLCGRPLGRIRVGAGGDFCSREHRNQYRLRRGMDCLTEANKVSTLARRRENPKALFADAAPGIARLAPRGFLEAPSMMLSAARRPAAPERRAVRDAGGHLPEASLAQLTRASAGPAGGPRAFGMKLPGAGRPAVEGRSAKPAAMHKARLADRYRTLGKVAPAASMGKAFRVAAKVGFRPPPMSAARGARAVAARAGPPAPGGLPAASRPVSLFVPARAAATERAGSRLAYGGMGFTGSPDAPAPVEWVGLVFRKGPGRKGRIA
jgi:hypothetical protein